MQYVRRQSISFGKTDAKSAIVTRDPEAKKLFFDSFVMPVNIKLDEIASGDRFLLYGSKGSGKTALLRYLMEEQKKLGNPTKFIVFSEDISQNDFSTILSDLDIRSVVKPEIDTAINVRDMWMIFLVKNICEILSDSGELFDGKSDLIKISKLISDVFGDNNPNILDKISEAIKGGTVRLKAAIGSYFEAESKIRFNNSATSKELNIGGLVESIIGLLSRIEYPKDVRYSLYIDEINLSMFQQKQHKKDSILVRDLILSIGRLNRIFAESDTPIYVYGAIRSEIARGLNVSRNEIDKYLIDHGQKIQWHEGFEVEQYPIFSVIEHRITAIEKNTSGRCNKEKDVWTEYFPNDIYGISPKRFISEITWCNPRDIVNLFNSAAGVQLSRPKYDTHVFVSVAERYSDLVWTERAEELNAEYSMTVVNAIKKLLTGFFRHFKVHELDRKAAEASIASPVLSQIRSTIGIEKICRDLYHVGVLGNSIPVNKSRVDDERVHKKERFESWFYRDSKEFDASHWLIVHRALYPTLGLGSWKAELFGLDPRMVLDDGAH